MPALQLGRSHKAAFVSQAKPYTSCPDVNPGKTMPRQPSTSPVRQGLGASTSPQGLTEAVCGLDKNLGAIFPLSYGGPGGETAAPTAC